MITESKRLKEVWKWKEDVYEKTRNMSKDERGSFFNRGLDDFMKKTGLKLKTIQREDVHLSDLKT